jgi:imidazolonepropionase-like amidohydrolase
MKADGMNCVKAFYDERAVGPDQTPPVPRLETLRALVKAGHAANIPVFVHALSTEAQTMALRSGADVIAHGLWEWNGESQAVELTPKVQGVLD